MEGWRQRRPGSNSRNPQGGRRKTDLTLTGLLMEGLRALSVNSATLCLILEGVMALWTAIAEYRGGTYISQVRAASVGQAIVRWARAFPLIKGSYVGTRTKTKFLVAARDPQEKPIRIKQTQNVWIWSPISVGPTVVVHLIKTTTR
jgi:hypothetical protein